MKVSWEGLPIELWYEIQLGALSHSLPLVCRRFYAIAKNASAFFHARYILGRFFREKAMPNRSDFFTRCLRYPICNQTVVQSICHLLKENRCNLVLEKNSNSLVRLPNRLGLHLRSASSTSSSPSSASTTTWTVDDEPLPFLRYLWECPDIPNLDLSSFILAKALKAKFIPLVEFLLDRETSTDSHHRLALQIAVRQKDLGLLKLLVEGGGHGKGRDPKTMRSRRLEKNRMIRVPLDAELLNLAIQVGAYDIASYLHKEKKVVPNLQTIKRLFNNS